MKELTFSEFLNNFEDFPGRVEIKDVFKYIDNIPFFKTLQFNDLQKFGISDSEFKVTSGKIKSRDYKKTLIKYFNGFEDIMNKYLEYKQNLYSKENQLKETEYLDSFNDLQIIYHREIVRLYSDEKIPKFESKRNELIQMLKEYDTLQKFTRNEDEKVKNEIKKSKIRVKLIDCEEILSKYKFYLQDSIDFLCLNDENDSFYESDSFYENDSFYEKN